jgi:hypothetical protein
MQPPGLSNLGCRPGQASPAQPGLLGRNDRHGCCGITQWRTVVGVKWDSPACWPRNAMLG